MRVTTLAFLVAVGILIALGVVFHSWVFSQFDGFNRWRTGFRPAESPNDAMGKFRDAIPQRKNTWAATYCTKDYADMLVKCDGPATRLGNVIDRIRDYMQANKLQTDQSLAVLVSLDPFPRHFKVKGAPKAINDREAAGAFVWEALPFSGTNFSMSQLAGTIDPKMY